jgi:thiamine biosynthesis lipoprotein
VSAAAAVSAQTTSPTHSAGIGRVHRRVEHVMGMPVSLAIRGRHADDPRGRTAWATALSVLRQADAVFSVYREESPISRLGRGEIGLDDCPPEVAEVLALGELARVASGGAFDVRRPGPDGKPLLDPSGVVKGWAVERAAAALDTLAETDYCLSAGGDMVCRVADPDGPPWRIGIEDPAAPTDIVAVVPMRAGGLATSAMTHRGAHIVDARTSRVPEGVASVTVVKASLTWADVDATSAFAHGRDALTWLSTRLGASGVVIWPDGTPEAFASPPDRARRPDRPGDPRPVGH